MHIYNLNCGTKKVRERTLFNFTLERSITDFFVALVFPDLSADRLAELGFHTNEDEDLEFNSRESTTISCRVTKLEVLPSLDEDTNEGECIPVDDLEGEA